MKRTLISWIAATFLAASANAVASVTLSYTGTPEPGSTITLETRVSVAPEDGTASSIFGRLIFPSTSFIATPTPATQFPFTPVAPGTPFLLGTLACTTTFCTQFSQNAGPQGAQSGDVSDFLLAMSSYTILPTTPVGTVLTWNWTSTPSSSRMSFFDAPILNPSLQITVIPEPATAALLALGLLGLAAARRSSTR